jgi:hypothetical protein
MGRISFGYDTKFQFRVGLAAVVAAVRAPDSTSQGARHRHLLQLRWWPLPKLPAAHPRGPAIDIIFNFGGGHYQNTQQHTLGDNHYNTK